MPSGKNTLADPGLLLANSDPDITTVAKLPDASKNGGSRYVVTDSSVTTFLSTVAAGGANKVPVFSNGANWIVG